ncbi:10972_t:CDS:10 [Ambispora gerdemannii]|uniref:Dolichyl-phosphate-mannose--protein mannosyltransferase n=1 Tax=Ambispora gerdemannii TaxID=144530 RepID=A0A9N8VPH6_9GLOM|nr:10972_t:CDS:10 [Ambispora gerdemannii]
MSQVRQRQGGDNKLKVGEKTIHEEKRKESKTPNEDEETKKKVVVSPGRDKQISNAVLFFLTVSSFITRFWNIGYPAEVVFDEVHFGKFASYYLQRTYYFDVHPPLAKLMFAGVGWLLGYDGHYLFENIGEDYIKNNVPYIGLRILPATLGALLVPIAYLIMIESGYPIITAAFAAGLVLFDNALITQTRLILLDAMLVFFMLCTLYSYIRFYKLRLREFTLDWWFWLVVTGVSLSLTTSVKMVGLFTFATIGVAVLVDLWELLDIQRGLTMRQFRRHFFARSIGLIFTPLAIYLFWFYLHFAILNTSGPGDDFMSPEFQETLHGNIMTFQSHDIRFNDTITIKHKDTSVFLHSHLDKYPLRYDDGRISSQGQQITGYPHEDSNNYWRVKPAIPFFDQERPENDVIKHGDYILLEHVNSLSHLLTHDVASPLMPTNQEFTTISVDDDSRYNETMFQVLIVNGEPDTKWRTKASHFRLVHYDTKVALWTHDAPLPDWAYKQQEVNGNKNNLEKSNYWFANEIIGKNVTEDVQPKKPTRELAFLRKFVELQRLMISHNSGLTKPHPYSTGPINWPFLVRGISFWTKDSTREQIYLLGNPFTWWIGVGALAVFVGVTAADAVSRRRGILPIIDPVRNRLYNSAGFFFIGWFFHYIPFFLMGRSLFLHHYLPAVICSYLLAAAVFNFMFVNSINYPISASATKKKITRVVLTAGVGVMTILFGIALLGIASVFYIFFAPLTYGTPGLDVSGVLNRKWLETWDFHFAK